MQSKFFASIIISLLLVTSVWAQQPPSWINLGDLPGAYQIRDVLEVPGQNVIFACGYKDNYWSAIWKTTNGGQNWTNILQGAHVAFVQLKRDSVSGRIWAVQTTGATSAPIYYTDDLGTYWTPVAGPSSSPITTAYAIELVGNYLYYGGDISNPYYICLYRMHKTTLQWEMVTQYTGCNCIAKLKYSNGKLLVFARDSGGSKMRVFSHTLSELDKNAKPIAAAKLEKIVEKSKEK